MQLYCQDYITILLSSGFTAKKDPEPIGVLDEPQNFKVEPGSLHGSIKLSLDKVKGAIVHIYEWAPAPVNEQTVWEFELGNTSIIIKNLVLVKDYAFRVAAKGTVEEKKSPASLPGLWLKGNCFKA